MPGHGSVYPLDCPSAIGWDVVGQAQGTPCRTDADNLARPTLTYKSVLP
jgi:hypothetical protein